MQSSSCSENSHILISWIAGDSASMEWEDIMLVLSLSKVHAHTLLFVCSGYTDWEMTV